MRIVSLVPAGTEIACALGAGDELVAVTHDCDYPPAVRALPRITCSTITPGSDSFAIDLEVRAAVERGESTFHLDAAALAAARPDVLLGQTLCEVCAVTVAQLPVALDPAPAVVPLDGHSLAGIFSDIARVGEALGRGPAAAQLVADLRSRIARVDALVAGAGRPTVVCLEWLAPLFNAGHWVPEQVAIAGGEDLLGRPLVPSIDVLWDDLVAADPEFLFLLPCGFDADRAVVEAAAVTARPEWQRLRAVRDGNVYALDGNAYFSRPGPRVVDGIELLASLLHPDRVSAPVGARSIRLTTPPVSSSVA
ncbi:MAG TPA: cobalamin-binding protein [Chloroflexi bacterium]|nr:cobalamin-binding protein [Chloroflexota bacterium]HAL28260.1 cobalamin-binding protein [Chloroflexota bacterium]